MARQVDDVRESPALDVSGTCVPLTDAALRDAALVVIITDHGAIDFQQVVDCASVVVDTRNALVRTRSGRAHIVMLSSEPLPSAGAVYAGCDDIDRILGSIRHPSRLEWDYVVRCVSLTRYAWASHDLDVSLDG